MEENYKASPLKLYSYWMSSCSFRVRLALNLKGLDYEYIPLVEGQQYTPEFMKLNPISYVPVLVDGELVIADSLAIILYLNEKYPHQHPLLPTDLHKKAINYQAASIVHSSIQPHQNQARYIEKEFGPDQKLPWLRYHIGKGFAALEKLLKDYAGRYATGDEVHLADIFLAPQLYAATKRFNIDMDQFPLLSRLDEAYSQLPAFQVAIPEKQPDAPSSRTS
ncbi:glutathione S-transferase zeta class isoform X2 [Ziziphus jujuba]|uniref:glutathione transferase n=1 Tax=Ziziphus jujuba TaxID=326968 RepID=A0ABM3IT43_ZIZJJ|nr:glutathione S-transferase zeta class isoform X2 [Ziziphus jujuba]